MLFKHTDTQHQNIDTTRRNYIKFGAEHDLEKVSFLTAAKVAGYFG
jgi:hypothetical protein